jgi:tetratricopeptide (TPR) repeat protein
MISRAPLIRTFVLTFLIFGVIAGGALFIAVSRPAFSSGLKGLDALLAHEQFDEAERRLQSFLHVHPDDPQANMLMAQVALARRDQKPELALRHLAKVRLRNPEVLAVVRLNEGKACSCLGHYLEAERLWLDALRIDPLVPEAGWALLGLYYVEGRRDEAHDLAMRLRAIEPDRRDRAQLLLELLRQDAKSLVYETIVPVLRPVARDHPDDVHAAIALARALIRTSQPDEGVQILHRLIERFPENALAWVALLSGLDESFRYDQLGEELVRLPSTMVTDVRFERYRGAVAQSKRKWFEAACAYRRALTSEPFDGQLLYRLCQSLRAEGRHEDAIQLETRRKAIETAQQSALALYEEANAAPSLGLKPHTDLYHRIADLREQMGRFDEARAWHELVVADDRDNPISRAALERLAARK